MILAGNVMLTTVARALIALVIAVMATPVMAATAQDNQSSIRFAYMAPASGNADIYWDATRTLGNVTYKTVTQYLQVPSGAHAFEVRPAGSPAPSPSWAHAQATLSAGAYYTIVVGGRPNSLQSTVLQDGFGLPGFGQAVVRFVHTAPEVPGVDVLVTNGPILFTNISFLQASSYSSAPAGTYSLTLRQAGTPQVLFTAGGVSVPAGGVRSLIATGGVGQPIELVQVLDAAAAGTAPAGGAATGGGGMAIRRPAAVALLTLALLVGFALTLSGRRRGSPAN
jgi:hypothetical protein